MEYSNAFVVAMGLGVVFFGLVCIILLTSIMGKLMYKPKKETPSAIVNAPAPVVETAAERVSPEELAIITAVLSNERNLGYSGVHITNIIKK